MDQYLWHGEWRRPSLALGNASEQLLQAQSRPLLLFIGFRECIRATVVMGIGTDTSISSLHLLQLSLTLPLLSFSLSLCSTLACGAGRKSSLPFTVFKYFPLSCHLKRFVLTHTYTRNLRLKWISHILYDVFFVLHTHLSCAFTLLSVSNLFCGRRKQNTPLWNAWSLGPLRSRSFLCQMRSRHSLPSVYSK